MKNRKNNKFFKWYSFPVNAHRIERKIGIRSKGRSHSVELSYRISDLGKRKENTNLCMQSSFPGLTLLLCDALQATSVSPFLPLWSRQHCLHHAALHSAADVTGNSWEQWKICAGQQSRKHCKCLPSVHRNFPPLWWSFINGRNRKMSFRPVRWKTIPMRHGGSSERRVDIQKGSLYGPVLSYSGNSMNGQDTSSNWLARITSRNLSSVTPSPISNIWLFLTPPNYFYVIAAAQFPETLCLKQPPWIPKSLSDLVSSIQWWQFHIIYTIFLCTLNSL